MKNRQVVCWSGVYFSACSIVAFVLACSGNVIASPHPFHISVAEMEFNPETKRFEVSLKMHASDLENAIAQRTGKRIDVEVEGGEAEIIDYLNDHFFLFAFPSNVRQTSADDAQTVKNSKQAEASSTAKAATRVAELKKVVRDLASEEDQRSKSFTKLHFVGKEMETTWIWIYFEMELPKGLLKNSPSDLLRAENSAPNREGEVAARSKTHQWGMQNSILLDVVQAQINTVSLRAGAKRVSLKFNASTYLADFETDWFSAAESARGSRNQVDRAGSGS
ncbi:MAG: DUF6702 family protein [Aureliella sp.]